MNSVTRPPATGGAAPEPVDDIELMDWPADHTPAAPTVLIALDDTVETPLLTPQRPAPAPVPRRSLFGRFAGWTGRTVRRTVAVAILLSVAWFWVLPFCFPVTSRAVVNARTVPVRAPIPGHVEALVVGVGDPVTAGEPVLRVSGRNVEVGHLSVARAKHAELTARRARLVTELASTAAAETACRAELERYTLAMVEQLGAARAEGHARVQVAKLELVAADHRLDRIRVLTNRGAGGVMDQEDAQDVVDAARARIDLEQAGLGRTEKELEAAGRGLFVTRDAPFYQLQARDLELKMTRLRTDLAETDDLLRATGTSVREEEDRVRALSDASVPAPTSGVVWKQPVGLNQLVARNEAVLDVADQRTVFVEALLHQRHLNSVTPGCRATVCLTGGGTLSGRVRAVRTPNTAEPEQGYALSLTDGDPRMLKVVISLDESVTDLALIGRHARILITGARPDRADEVVEWLFTRLRF